MQHLSLWVSFGSFFGLWFVNAGIDSFLLEQFFQNNTFNLLHVAFYFNIAVHERLPRMRITADRMRLMKWIYTFDVENFYWASIILAKSSKNKYKNEKETQIKLLASSLLRLRTRSLFYWIKTVHFNLFPPYS